MRDYIDYTAEEIEENYTQEEIDKVEAITLYHGDYYYNTFEEALEATEDSILSTVKGVSNDYELARKLEYETGYEELLYKILGCTEEAYNSLSQYIHTDDIAHTIDVEFYFSYVNGTAYEVLT